MDPLITLQDFTDRYHDDVPEAEELRVEALLDDASALVRDVAGSDFIVDGEVATPPSLIPVVYEVTRRAVDNPAGYDSETIGSYTWRNERSGSGIYLNDQERRAVLRAVGRSGLRAVEVDHHYGFSREQHLPDTEGVNVPYWPVSQ